MTTNSNFTTGEIAAFGAFRLAPAERLLHKGDIPIVLGSRALDILTALVESAGEVLSQRELIARAWPKLIVEEANLRIHIAALRKVLGDGEDKIRYITNVPGRGYCFVAPVQRSTPELKSDKAVLERVKATTVTALPIALARMIGREETVDTVLELLRTGRFVSIVGPGGMGKTTVAVSIAHILLNDFENRVFFVDLGTLTDPAMLPAAIASAMGVSSQAPDLLASLVASVADQRTLLLIDNCEHVIDAAAKLVERLFSEAPRMHLITTSRESLRVQGEHVYRLLPLGNPPASAELTAAQALAAPSVQLFMERAAAGGHRLALNDADAPVVASICCRLDGIALAIELVAGRVGIYGIYGTADLLDTRFRLLWEGRRTAVPRHQTLHAMLEWSYALLSDRDRRALCRLTVFVEIFTLEAAQAVACDSEMDARQIVEALASLIEKSLVRALSVEGKTFHCLLDTTRVYSAGKLIESGDAREVAMRYALYYLELLRSGEVDRGASVLPHMASVALPVSDIQAALEWCFSNRGDRHIGVQLAAQAAPLLLKLSMLSECQKWCAQGLAALGLLERGTKLELELQEAFAISKMLTQGNCETVRAAIERGLNLTELLGEVERQVHLLAGLHIFLTRTGDFREALIVAKRNVLRAKETGSSAAMVAADWMLGCSYHLMGDQEAARRYCELGLKRAAVEEVGRIDIFGYDHQVRALIILARVLWLHGRPTQAIKVAREATDKAEKRYHSADFCAAMILTTSVFLWNGDFEEAKERIDLLSTFAAKHSLRPYQSVGLALRGELEVALGNSNTGVKQLREALLVLHSERHDILSTGFSRALAEGLIQSGRYDEASTIIEDALAGAEGQGTILDMPDLLRMRSVILMASSRPDRRAAEETLLKSIDCARIQSALSLELRATMALARLWQEQRRTADAWKILAGVYERFTEGFETIDLQAAARLITELEHSMDTIQLGSAEAR
ncbi:ATP-binding protein [Undibacterium sp. TJN25]|uniref:ATP-binding protein n=1 Tax=Undibacterium sp. TJN25 TaxID=3413056 RepID=UPI003BF124D7